MTSMSVERSRFTVWLFGAFMAIGCTTTPVATPDDLDLNGGQGPGHTPNEGVGAPTPSGEDDLQPLDVDDDDIPNAEDNCPATPNPGQEDGDADGVGDACDDCPTVSDSEQEDANDDNVGDACAHLPPPPPFTPPAPPPPTTPPPLCDNGDDLCRIGG